MIDLNSTRSREFYFDIARGVRAEFSKVHKFGAHDNVGTSFEPVATGGIYRTPQVAGAVSLRVKAGGHANDTEAGSGAQEVTFQGLDETGAEVIETVATAGASASAGTTTTFLRLYRMWISASGTYAGSAAGSHAASITIEDAGGVADWAIISADVGFPMGQSEIGAYTVPLGKIALIPSFSVSVDSTKSSSIIGFSRENILETTAPYTAMRAFLELGGVSGEAPFHPDVPYGPFPPLTDVGFMAKVTSGSARVDVDFEIVLIDE